AVLARFAGLRHRLLEFGLVDGFFAGDHPYRSDIRGAPGGENVAELRVEDDDRDGFDIGGGRVESAVEVGEQAAPGLGHEGAQLLGDIRGPHIADSNVNESAGIGREELGGWRVGGSGAAGEGYRKSQGEPVARHDGTPERSGGWRRTLSRSARGD